MSAAELEEKVQKQEQLKNNKLKHCKWLRISTLNVYIFNQGTLICDSPSFINESRYTQTQAHKFISKIFDVLYFFPLTFL